MSPLPLIISILSTTSTTVNQSKWHDSLRYVIDQFKKKARLIPDSLGFHWTTAATSQWCNVFHKPWFTIELAFNWPNNLSVPMFSFVTDWCVGTNWNTLFTYFLFAARSNRNNGNGNFSLTLCILIKNIFNKLFLHRGTR